MTKVINANLEISMVTIPVLIAIGSNFIAIVFAVWFMFTLGLICKLIGIGSLESAFGLKYAFLSTLPTL